MSITINGTSGISGVDGSAGTPALQGSDTNTGISFGTDEVNINTGGTTRATVDSSGNLKFNSGYGSVATAYGCRAWVNFDGTSASIGSGRENGNVSSITDQATGTYTINFTTDMPDVNYAALVTSGFASGTREDLLGFVYTDAPLAMATSSVSVKFVRADTNAAIDTNYGMVAVFR